MARLTLEDIANRCSLVVDDLSVTCLDGVTNPRTGLVFKVGDAVEVAAAYSKDGNAYVELVGVQGSWTLLAFRMPTEYDLRKALIATADSPRGRGPDLLKETMKATVDALAAGGYGKKGRSDVVGPDQEDMVRSRIETAIRMGIAAYRATCVRADSLALSSAINGIANGTAVEVLQALGLKLGYVNLRPVRNGEPVTSEPSAAIPRCGKGGGHGA